MQCPACGSAIWNEQATACPTCGQRLSGGGAPSSDEPQPGVWPGNSAPEAGQAAPGGSIVTPEMPAAGATPSAPATPGTWPNYPPPPPGYAPPMPLSYAPPPLPGYAPGYPPPEYGQAAPPSTYPYPYPYPYAPPTGAAYGQPAPPPYVPYASAPYAPYPPPLSPMPAPRKRSGGRIALLVVGIVAAVVVLCGGGLGLLYYAGTHLSAQAGPGGNPFITPGATSATSTGPLGTVVYQDSMTNSTSNWNTDPGHCFYGSDGYHVAARYLCYSPAGIQRDFDVSVQVKQISGLMSVAYGIAFRATNHESFYGFYITGESTWGVYECYIASSVCQRMIGFTTNAAIQGGLDASNTLEVRGIGSQFQFFVNGVQVGQTVNADFTSGLIGILGGNDIECVFTNFIVTRPS